MTLWALVLILVACGALLWLLEQAPFISASAKPFIRWIVLVVMVLVVLNALGALQFLKTTTIGR